ncbi:hypothetical protein AAFN88_14650 [Pelagibius sp. CAU 1746]
MNAALYIALGFGAIGLLFLLHRYPQLAGAVFLLSAAVGGTILLLQ